VSGYDYITQAQFLAAYSAAPFLYLELTDGAATVRVALASHVLVDAGGDRSAVYGRALSFPNLSELLSESIQASQAVIVLDGLGFDASLLGWTGTLMLGDPKLTSDLHRTLYVGVVIAESRQGRQYSITLQEDVFLRLSHLFLPRWRVRDDSALAAAAETPAAALDKFAPLAFGELASPAGVAGRLAAVPLKDNNAGGSGVNNEWLICQLDSAVGCVYEVTAVWKNGAAVAGFSYSAVTGNKYRYLKVVLTGASVITDALTVDVIHQPAGSVNKPFQELHNFLTSSEWLGLPAAAVKVDRSFIEDSAAETGDYEYLASIVSLARSRDKRVIFEGVSSAEVHERVRALRPDGMQGFHFSHPMEAKELVELVERDARLPV